MHNLAKHSLTSNVFEAPRYHKEWQFSIGNTLFISVMEDAHIPNRMQRFLLKLFFDFRWTKINARP